MECGFGKGQASCTLPSTPSFLRLLGAGEEGGLMGGPGSEAASARGEEGMVLSSLKLIYYLAFGRRNNIEGERASWDWRKESKREEEREARPLRDAVY